MCFLEGASNTFNTHNSWKHRSLASRRTSADSRHFEVKRAPASLGEPQSPSTTRAHITAFQLQRLTSQELREKMPQGKHFWGRGVRQITCRQPEPTDHSAGSSRIRLPWRLQNQPSGLGAALFPAAVTPPPGTFPATLAAASCPKRGRAGSLCQGLCRRSLVCFKTHKAARGWAREIS